MLTLLDAARLIRSGELSPLELTEEAITCAEAAADLNALALLDSDGGRAQAAELEREAKAGAFRGPLHGVPVTVKDLFNVEGLPTRGGTQAPLPDLEPPEAPAVTRLRAAGAVILGKANMHEIALGVTGENPWTGDVKNPRDPARQAGGSSSGSAAAVASGIGFASLGTDTGGSIRIPAALCGLVGFKPTHGLVQLTGALALSPTCDHAGPLTRTVADARALFEVLSGRALEPRVPERSVPRLGVPRAYLAGALGPQVRATFEGWLEEVTGAGAEVVDVAPADLELAASAYTPLVRAEAVHVHRVALATQPEGFSEPTRRALTLGAALGAGEYLEARRLRRMVRAGLDAVLTTVDALVLPTTPVLAPLRGAAEVALESGPSPHRDAFLRLTAPFSLVGLPALSLPYAEANGLPLGVQVVGPWGADAAVLEIGAWLERLST